MAIYMTRNETENDIYGQEARLANYLTRIQASPAICSVNKAALARFFSDHAEEAAGNTSVHRRIFYAMRLLPLAEQVGDKDFMTLEKPDYERLAEWVRTKRIEYTTPKPGNANRTRPREGQLLSFETQRIYATALKKFLKYLHDWEVCPKELNRAFQFTGKTQGLKPEDLLSAEEVQRITDAADNFRDKALIAVLAETGFRASELATLKVKSVMADENGYKLSLQHSKTQVRTVRMAFYTIHLKNWLRVHPAKNDGNAPLWVTIEGHNKGQRMGYAHVRMAILRAAQRAGVTKAVNPHSFRHLKVSRLAALGLNEAQTCQTMGWTQGSKMMKIYSHLSEKQTDDAYLTALGLRKNENKQVIMAANACPHCGATNKPNDETCLSCKLPLQLGVAITYDLGLESLNAQWKQQLEQLELRLIAHLEKIKV
jgi:integrase